MTNENLTLTNVENTNASNGSVETSSAKEAKKTSFTGKVKEVSEIGGYVSGVYASEYLTKQAGKNIPVTTVNNLAYSQKIEAVKIAGVFLFKKSGDNSLEAYVPHIHEKNQHEKERDEKNVIKVKQAKAKELFAKYVNAAIEKGETPNFEAIAKELGIGK